ncbi:hypothetical protein [Streptomyces sp. NPDC001450]
MNLNRALSVLPSRADLESCGVLTAGGAGAKRGAVPSAAGVTAP